MPDPTSSTKVFLFRLNNWTIEKEHALLDKFEAYGLNDHWQGYNPPGHPAAVRGLYFVPDTQELRTQVERLVAESVTLNMSILGTYDLEFPRKTGHGYAVILSLNSTGLR